MKGEVVGINTAIMAEGQGIGFAIPINMAKEVSAQLKDKGHVTRGWLGVAIQEVTPELAKSFPINPWVSRSRILPLKSPRDLV